MIAEQHSVPTQPAIAIALAKAVFGSRKLSRSQAFMIAPETDAFDMLYAGGGTWDVDVQSLTILTNWSLSALGASLSGVVPSGLSVNGSCAR